MSTIDLTRFNPDTNATPPWVRSRPTRDTKEEKGLDKTNLAIICFPTKTRIKKLGFSSRRLMQLISLGKFSIIFPPERISLDRGVYSELETIWPDYF